MKLIWKLNIAVAIIGITLLVSCGPSAEEKAAMEKAKQDSIAAYQAEGAVTQQLLTAPTANYIKLVAAEYNARNSNVEVFMVGADTIIVVTGANGFPVVVKK